MRKSFFAKTVTGSLLMFGLAVLLTACEHELPNAQQQPPPSGLRATLSSIQTNIFTPKCVNAGCHPGGGAPMSLRAGDSFSTLVGINSAYGRPRVAAGNANNSALYLKVIGNAATGSRMPLGSAALSQAETDSIRAWINRGAQNN
ncbi:MAG: hypothetical protein ONB46_08890 [candidate division KSB1 bacterium]|nr:hypothetical protein [candidate division KSB1 bacterium]MDZ7365860.1 hypothetical protein [candidate division KSB1 bacterium]MDZ7403905.1 hypothetical protein [candidate division KSB1 bacterium]